MPKPRNLLTAEYVKSLLNYNPKTGIFKWRVNRRPRGKKGKRAGCRRPDGYILIGIDGSMYLGHRLAWLIMMGSFPLHQIDHKNLNPSDLRWKNLRAATHAQNKQNQRPNKNNKAGIKGVYKRKDCNRWAAMIDINGKTRYLGLFKSAKEAKSAYITAAKQHFKEFAYIK